MLIGWVLVDLAYNPSYLEGQDWEDFDSKPARENC
jgi:hypothetical protein